jgi:hypothetical protein
MLVTHMGASIVLPIKEVTKNKNYHFKQNVSID